MNSFQTLTLFQTIRQRRIASTAVVASLLFALTVAAVACKGKADTPAVNYARVPDGAPQNSYADVVSRVAPAVVTIHANKRVRQPQQFPFFDDPFPRGDRNQPQQQQPREQLER